MSKPILTASLLALSLLAPLAPAAAQSGFALEDANGGLKVLEGGRPVLVYNYGLQLAPGAPEAYRRSTYVHPLWDHTGSVVLTDDFPRDHFHHRGLSWMWPRVLVGGQEYDLWHIKGIRQQFVGWLERSADATGATVAVRNAWQLADRTVLDEEVRIRVHPAEAEGRALDVTLKLTAREPIQIRGTEEGDKGYGGFVLRFAPREDTRITTAEGVQAKDSDHLSTPWADESGRFGGSDRVHGVSIFQHPDNPGFPSAWTLRHYGFVGSAWPGLRGVTLAPGEPVTLRYRVWVHAGDATAGQVADRYRRFGGPGGSAPAARR